MAPPPGGAPSPDEAMALDQQGAEAKVESIMQTRPTPTKPYSVAAVKTLATQASAAVDKIAGTDVPMPEWQAEGGGKLVDPETKEPLQLPGEVFLPVAILSEAIKAVDVDGAFEKYIIDPAGLTDDGALKVAASKLKMAAGDKALATALMQPQGEMGNAPGDEPERLKKPDEMSDDEKTLSENM